MIRQPHDLCCGAQLEPDAVFDAVLIGGLAEPVTSAPRRLFGGGWAVLAAPTPRGGPVGDLLVLDDELAVVGRFPVPTGIFGDEETTNDWRAYSLDPESPTWRFDVSPDRRLAVFAGATGIVVVDREGGARWRISHPTALSPLEASIERPSRAVFSPDGGHLWCFVPRLDPTGWRPTVERWRIDVSGWRTIHRHPTRYDLNTDLLLHPDGRHAGYAFSDTTDPGWDPDIPHPTGRWVRWDDDTEDELVTRSGPFEPVDIHPGGDRWLAITEIDSGLLVGGFGDGPPYEILPHAGADDDPHVYDDCDERFLAACLIADDLVLADIDDEQERRTALPPQLIFGVDPPRRLGVVRYPPARDAPTGSRWQKVVTRGAGDGTWLTFSARRGLGPLRRWAPSACLHDTGADERA